MLSIVVWCVVRVLLYLCLSVRLLLSVRPCILLSIACILSIACLRWPVALLLLLLLLLLLRYMLLPIRCVRLGVGSMLGTISLRVSVGRLRVSCLVSVTAVRIGTVVLLLAVGTVGLGQVLMLVLVCLALRAVARRVSSRRSC